MQAASSLHDAVIEEKAGIAARRPVDWDRFDLPPGAMKERFRRARRRGHAAWLWPEVPIEDWRAALQRIEYVVRQILQGGSPPALDGDERALGLACYTSGLGPLLGWWLEQGRLTAPPAVASLLALHLWHNARRQERVEMAARHLVRSLSERGIGVLVLKGLHTGAVYFPHPATRPVSDIDMLVNAIDAAAAERVLREGGFAERGRNARESNWALAGMAYLPRSLMIAHAGDPWSVDLHSTLDLTAGEGSPRAMLDRARPMTAHATWPPERGARVLDQPLLALHLAVHAGAGLHSLSLLRLVELQLVIAQDRAAGRLSWDRFVALGAEAGALGLAFPALSLCEALVPDTIPGWVLHACAAAAPARAQRVVARLTPATAQRVERSWISEHYMWVEGIGGWLRQLASDLVPAVPTWRGMWAIYERRLWRLLRGRIG